MRRLIATLCLLAAFGAKAACIVSGDTTTGIYFYAVDENDKVTPETGLTSFTVYRTRNGGTPTAFTTPTITELDSSNMPGWYFLVIDEDTTISSGKDKEYMGLHITHAGMQPVPREICIERPKISVGETLAVTSGAVDSVAGDVGGIAPNGLTLDAFNVDTNPLFGILYRGTAQSASETGLVLDSGASFGDDALNGATLFGCGSTQGYCQSRVVTDYAGSSATATVDAWPVTPSGTITFFAFGTAPSSGDGSGPTAEQIADEVETRELTVGGLTSTAQAHVRASVGLDTANLDTQLGTIDSVADGTASAVSELAGVVDAIKGTTDKLDDTLEDNSGTYRFTEAALAQAPSGEGGGGGGTDWDADERAAIRAILGIPVSGSAPADPSSGILDTIRDSVANLNDVSTEDVQAASAAALAQYDGPTRDELASEIESVLSAISELNGLDPTAVRDLVIEDQGGGVTLGCALSVLLAYAAGDLTTTANTPTYRDPSGSETRISGTISSAGNRSMTITCPAY